MSKRFEKGLFWRQNDAREDEEEGGIDWNDFPQHATWPNPNNAEEGSAKAKPPETMEEEAFAKGSAIDFPQQVTWPDLKETQVSSEEGTPVAKTKTSVALEEKAVADRAAWSKPNNTPTVETPVRSKKEAVVTGEATDFPLQVLWPNPNETLRSSEGGSPAAKMPETSEKGAVAEGTTTDSFFAEDFSSSDKFPAAKMPETSEKGAVAEGTTTDGFLAEDFSSSDKFKSDQKHIPRGQQHQEPEEFAQHSGAQCSGVVAVGSSFGVAASQAEQNTVAFAEDCSSSDKFKSDQKDIPRGQQYPEPEEFAQQAGVQFPGAVAVGSSFGVAGSHDEENTVAETIIDRVLPHAVSARLVNDQEDDNRKILSLYNQILEERANAPLAVVVADVDAPINRDVSESESGPSRLESENGPSRCGPKRRRLGLLVVILLTAVIVLVVVFTGPEPDPPPTSSGNDTESQSPSSAPSPSQSRLDANETTTPMTRTPTITPTSPLFVASLPPSPAPTRDAMLTPTSTSSPVAAAVPSLPPTPSPVLPATPTMSASTMRPSVLGSTTLPTPTPSTLQPDANTTGPTTTSPAVSAPSLGPTPQSSMTPTSPASYSSAPSSILQESSAPSLSPTAPSESPAAPSLSPTAPPSLPPASSESPAYVN